MRLAGRLSAAIDILTDFDTRRVPLKTAIADWSRGARYAGAKDRAWISGLCLDMLRRRMSLTHRLGLIPETGDHKSEDDATPTKGSVKLLVLGAAHWLWREDLDAIAEACTEEHGCGALTDDEHAALSADPIPADLISADPIPTEKALVDDQPSEQSSDQSVHALSIAADVPPWIAPLLERAFGPSAAMEGAALADRAAIDLRMNTLKSTPEKTLPALKNVHASAVAPLITAARIPPPDPSLKAPAVTVIPAFNKGWVEVQDLGSQIAAAAAGQINGAQVMDFCAGGGGKTLALGALMNNTGQLYAHDIDARRLAPVYHRAKRAGVRNLQILDPKEGAAALNSLRGKMDVVFLDAPCSGAGTWRRRPDTKWRLSEKQLVQRMAEQDVVLNDGAEFVKPGGVLIYVTCSVFIEENEDRVDAFLRDHTMFNRFDPVQNIHASGLLSENAADFFDQCKTVRGDMQLSPARTGTDGFFISAMRRTG